LIGITRFSGVWVGNADTDIGVVELGTSILPTYNVVRDSSELGVRPTGAGPFIGAAGANGPVAPPGR
jgi:hypothetical protein